LSVRPARRTGPAGRCGQKVPDGALTGYGPNMKKDSRHLLRDLAYISTAGLSMAFSITIGLFFGLYLDKRVFNTMPWFTIVFLIVGIIAGFKNLYLIYKRAIRVDEEQGKKD
jgi:ATP synthase protein I